MAKGMPDALQLRELKYGAKAQPAQQVALANKLLAANRVAEALDLLLIAGDEAGIAKIRTRAIAEGRPVWLLMMERVGHAISKSDWDGCGRAAESAGRWREAYRAFTRAGDEDALTRVREKLPDYEIYVPEGK
ncbi:MAG: hypothetical protein ACYTGZ_09305 [Planctomycetota bacterium]|jgi:hypothetical protein